MHLSNHNSIKLEINHKKKSGNNANMWKLNNVLLNYEWVNQEMKEEIKKYVETRKMKHSGPKSLNRKSCSKREVYTNTSLYRGKFLPQEKKKKISNNLNLNTKRLEKEHQTKPKISRRKKNNKD